MYIQLWIVNITFKCSVYNIFPLYNDSTCGLGEMPWPPLGHDGPQGPEGHQPVLHTYAYCGWWSKPMWVSSPAWTWSLFFFKSGTTMYRHVFDYFYLVLVTFLSIVCCQGLCRRVMPSWMFFSLMVWSLRWSVHVPPLLRPWLWPFAGTTSAYSHALTRDTLILEFKTRQQE